MDHYEPIYFAIHVEEECLSSAQIVWSPNNIKSEVNQNINSDSDTQHSTILFRGFGIGGCRVAFATEN